jgi:hypothetical protein
MKASQMQTLKFIAIFERKFSLKLSEFDAGTTIR